MKNISSLIKKHWKKAGTLLMIAAFVFIVKRIISMDVDYSVIFNGKTALYTVLCILIQTGIIIFMCCPWVKFIEILSSEKIPLRKAVPVFAKSNFLKYIPGNVFQYIGRNKLAFDMGISHADVACATVIDVIFTVAAPCVIGILLIGRNVIKIFEVYGKSFFTVACAGMLFVLAAVLILIKFRSRFSAILEKYKKVFVKENIKRMLITFLYYLVQNVVTVLMCVILITKIIGMTQGISGILMLSGVYLFSWIVGFITPGAPGGIGVREAVMMLMCSKIAGSDDIMLFVIVMRIISIAGDALAFAAGALIGRRNDT